MSDTRDDFIISIRSALLKRGAKQKFSLFFLICFSLLVFTLDSYPLKFMDFTRSILNDLVYRVSAIASTPVKLINYVNIKTQEHFSIYAENKRMKEALILLENKNFDYKFLELENKKFKEILNSEEKTIHSTVLARVIVDKNSPFIKSVVINKGSNSNIKKGMPVIYNNYLVGRIVEVNYLSSRVLLLNDLNSRVPVIIDPKGYQAILTGKGDRNPFLAYLPEIYEREVGSTIFTSGKDGIFPSGIPVGTTLSEEEFYSAQLLADPTQLSLVNVILKESKFKRTDIEWLFITLALKKNY